MKLALSNTGNPHNNPDPLSNAASNRRVRDVGFFAAGVLAYWVLVSFFSWFHGVNIIKLSPFFVGAAGCFLGMRAGLLASIIALVSHMVVFDRAGLGGPLAAVRLYPAIHIGIALLGPVTGYLRTKLRRTREDLCSREETADEFSEVESRFHQIVDNIHEVFWIVSADRNHMIYVSPAFETVFGVKSELIMDNPRIVLDLVHPDDRDRVEVMLNTVPNDSYLEEYRIQHPDGKIHWIQSRGFIIPEKQGAVKRLAGMSTDITTRKNAALSLQASEERYRDLVEKLPAIVYVAPLDLTLPLAYVSPQIEFMLGFQQQEWTSNSEMFARVYHPDDHEWVTRELSRCIADSRRFVADYRMIHKNGTVRWVHDEADILLDKNGEPMLLQGVIQDITQHRFSERMRLGRTGVLEKLSAGATLPEVLTSLVGYVEELVPGSICTICLIDRETRRIYHGAFTNPAVDIFNLCSNIDSERVTGCIDRAISSGERVVEIDSFIENLEAGPRERAQEAGLSACWAVPVRSSNEEILGVAVVYPGNPREPSTNDEEVLLTAVELATVSIEQRNTEAALRENEERLRLFIRHSPAPMAMFDTNMRYLVASSSWISEHRLEDRDLTGQLHYDVLPDLPEQWKLNHQKCLEGTILEEEAERIIHPDGTIDWIKWAMHPWRQEDDTIGGIIVYEERVTDRILGQQRLARSEEQYRFLVEHIPDSITELDPDGNILFANHTIYEARVEDLIGTSVFDYIPADRRDEIRRLIAGAVLSREPRNYSVVIDSADGPSWWSNRIVPVQENGIVVRLLVLGTNTTDRKIAEDALRRSEKRYRSLFEDNLAGDFIATPAGNIITCNAAFVTIFGFHSKEEALSFNAANLFPDRRAWDEFLKRLETDGRLKQYEEELRSKHGKTVYVVANFVGGFDGSGHLTEIKGYVFDNTAQKRLEEQLIQAQKMEAVGRLAGGIAHDFNNMLTSISGYNELLLNKIDPDGPLYRYSQEVMKATDRAASLTKRLLAFSRQQMVQPRVIDILGIVRNMESVLQRTIGENIELETVSGPGDCFIEADPSLIETVVLNLAINARDAMPDGGKLTIGTDNVSIDKVNQHKTPGIELGDYVLLSFSDTGLDMDGAIQSKIFEPFFTTKQDGKGTGLGLATVYGSVRQSGGHVRVHSQPHKGATFSLYFPAVVDRAPQAATKQVFLGPSRGSETVLVAEDEPTVQRLIREVLSSKGYRVLQADDGAEALAVVEKHNAPVHLLITDVVMPRMNGRELVTELRSRYPQLKVLYISGYIGKASVKIAELGPGTSFLSKPFSAEALARKIRLLLDAPAPGVSRRQPRTRSLHHPA